MKFEKQSWLGHALEDFVSISSLTPELGELPSKLTLLTSLEHGLKASEVCY
jgi:hypothetical protein